MLFFFFFQAEDGIRDKLVTGVQTCALPILVGIGEVWRHLPLIPAGFPSSFARRIGQPILRAPLRPSGRPATSDARRRSSWWKKPTLRVKFLGSDMRSEEHTSELQSLAYLVCRLLLEKKK